MILPLLLLLAASSHAAPLVGTQDLQPNISISSAVAIGTTTAATSALTVYGIITSSTTTPTVTCTAGSPTVTAGSTSQFGSYASGIAATGCTLTFGKSFPSTPFCQCQSNANLLVYNSAVSKTQLTCTSASAMTGDTITWLCNGPP